MTGPEPTPVEPKAATLWPILELAGVAHHVNKITSGRDRTLVRIRHYENPQWTDTALRGVAQTLRALWTDSDTRVRERVEPIIEIDRRGYWKTERNTPEGRLRLAGRTELRRRELLTMAVTHHLSAGPMRRNVQCEPVGNFDRPWVDRHGQRYDTLDIYVDEPKPL